MSKQNGKTNGERGGRMSEEGLADLINTPLQRGVRMFAHDQNRFNGFPIHTAHAETIETV